MTAVRPSGLQLTVVLRRRSVQVLLWTHTGQIPRVTSVVFADVTNNVVLWSLLPAVFAQSADPGPDIPEAYQVRATVQVLPFDPSEFLPPTHPVRIALLRASAALERKTLLPLGSVTYGTVPVGFHQTYPEEVGPVPLEAGHRYSIAVRGAHHQGSRVFTIDAT